MVTEPKDILVVMVTAANQEEAAKISDQAVRSRQAACATTIPIVHSTYWWEGKLMSDQESMVLLKTTADKFQALQETIQRMHSYKVPEIIAIPVANGLPQYLEWVQRETS
ncbi:MAG: divalent-cation tolerance protein CutA [Nitrospira sp.]|nr:MAG: divalent-cation tolerance protein CutA [Nitrospira sp.]